MAGIGSMNRQKASDMRHRIQLLKPVVTKDASRQPITTWENELSLQPARFMQVNGGETIRGRQVEAGVTAIFTVNYRSEYSVEKQVLFNGVRYGITRVYAPDGVNRFAEIHCKAAPVG